jgi:ankyrin repeat protein
VLIEIIGVYIAVYFRLERVIIGLLNNRSNLDKVNIDSKDLYRRTLLLRAVENRHKAIVKLLLKIGKINIDFKDTKYI